MTFSVRIDGINEIQTALANASAAIEPALRDAGQDAVANVVLSTYGTPGNYPEYTSPTYTRGTDPRSERLGTQYADSSTSTTYAGGATTLTVGASYAEPVVGNPPSAVMQAIGWRSLVGVVMDKIQAIQDIYQKWIDNALQKAGLK